MRGTDVLKMLLGGSFNMIDERLSAVTDREWSERAKIPRHQHAVNEGLEQPDCGGLDCWGKEAGREHHRGGPQE